MAYTVPSEGWRRGEASAVPRARRAAIADAASPFVSVHVFDAPHDCAKITGGKATSPYMIPTSSNAQDGVRRAPPPPAAARAHAWRKRP